MIMEGNYDESKVTMAAIIAWAIWSNRNEVCNGGRVVHESGWVGFGSNQDLTRRRQVEGQRNPEPTARKIGRVGFG